MPEKPKDYFYLSRAAAFALLRAMTPKGAEIALLRSQWRFGVAVRRND
jgi:hypothetical protein